MTIVQFHNNLRELDLRGIAYDLVISDEETIVNYQKDQMMSGKDATGKDIAPSYKYKSYAELKRSMNNRPQFWTPDLKYSGEFHSGFYLDHDTLTVTSSDAKTPSLIKKYGEWIFGFNKETMRKYAEGFKDMFFEKITDTLSMV